MLNKVEISGRKPWTEPWSGGAKRGIEVQKGVAGMIGPTGEGRGRLPEKAASLIDVSIS